MKKKTFIPLVILLFCCQVSFCYALEWKKLHERAEKERPADALKAVVKDPNSPQALYTLALVYLNLFKHFLLKGLLNLWENLQNLHKAKEDKYLILNRVLVMLLLK